MGKTYTVRFQPQNKTVEVEAGVTILEAERLAGLEPDAPCGGQGKCGKCKVNILQGKKQGEVLSCQTPVDSDLVVDTMSQEKVHQILTGGSSRQVLFAPGVSRDKPFWLMAFDIGTTTVVGYLLDGTEGKQILTVSRMNPQHEFGADVISRANYVLEEGEKGGQEMRACIVKALNALIGEACAKVGLDRSDILQVSIVGNTCMHHLLLGISPDSLVHAPYIPAVKKGMLLKPEEVGLQMAEDGTVVLLPNIAGFVGADTVGCMLAVAFDQLEMQTLMIDIGTNGELVMGNKTKMVTTSTAAGPAFEGAKIECGMRGSSGAISHLKEKEDGIELEIVDEVKPVGICGSGLIDVVAFLIRHGFVNCYGGFRDREDIEEDADPLAIKELDRLIEVHGQPAFLLIPAEETQFGTAIYLTQKDLREVQLAKGAIAAGIEIMADKLGISIEDIQQVFLAGAFGTYMDAESACEIGLIPYELKERILPIGNAAGEGAKLAVINRNEYDYACRMSEEVDFIELATESCFQDVFVDQLEFQRAVED
ncbi:MAG: ASKHA domain-containing protein [Eubacteriales bacterium]|nr:ASKHA domain-containing protein [Eubacteriales bacterium]